MIDSPDFDAPRLAGPYLKALVPNTFQIQVERPSEASQTQSLRFEIASEDLGTHPPQGRVVIDFPGFGRPFPDQFQHEIADRLSIAPGHIDTPRTIETGRFALGVWPLGCHSVSVIVAHQFENTPLTIQPALDPDTGERVPVAMLTWWYLLVPDQDQPADDIVDLARCNANRGLLLDGGSDSASAVVP